MRSIVSHFLLSVIDRRRFNDDGEIVYNFEFTAADMAIVEPLLIDSDYVNSNIISTSVDTSVSRFDRQ